MMKPEQELPLMVVQRQWFLEMKSPPGEVAMKTVEMTTGGLEYDMKLVDKAVAEFERTESSFEGSLL